jgi:hypothetical protein
VEDETSEKVNLDTKEEKSPEFIEDGEGVLWYKEKICVPDVKESNDKILCEVHESPYSIHLGRNKMYHDHEATYWWYEIKRDVAEYIALCDTCQS